MPRCFDTYCYFARLQHLKLLSTTGFCTLLLTPQMTSRVGGSKGCTPTDNAARPENKLHANKRACPQSGGSDSSSGLRLLVATLRAGSGQRGESKNLDFVVLLPSIYQAYFQESSLRTKRYTNASIPRGLKLYPFFGRRLLKTTGAPTRPTGRVTRGISSTCFRIYIRYTRTPCHSTVIPHSGGPAVQRYPGAILPPPPPRVFALCHSAGGVNRRKKT